MQVVKGKIKRIDLFSSSANLRVNGEPEYESVCGGLLSLIVIAVFISIFAGQILSVINKEKIVAQSSSTNDASVAMNISRLPLFV